MFEAWLILLHGFKKIYDQTLRIMFISAFRLKFLNEIEKNYTELHENFHLFINRSRIVPKIFFIALDGCT